jgi:hypothetical protein
MLMEIEDIVGQVKLADMQLKMIMLILLVEELKEEDMRQMMIGKQFYQN